MIFKASGGLWEVFWGSKKWPKNGQKIFQKIPFWKPKKQKFWQSWCQLPQENLKTMSKNLERFLATQNLPIWVKRGLQNHRKSLFLGACSRIWGFSLKSIPKHRFWTTFSGKRSQILLQRDSYIWENHCQKNNYNFFCTFLLPLESLCWGCALFLFTRTSFP